MSLVSLVDDDVSVRKSLDRLTRSAGLEVNVFASAEEFLNSAHPNKTDCLIWDVRMPGMRGFELHHHLMDSNCKMPVVFMTPRGYDRTRSEASSHWTVAYLTKPFSEDELLDAVHKAWRLKASV